MIQFEIKNRFTGGVQFTAEIDCDQDASASVKIGLSVKWAILNRASLDGASLDGAILDGACLDRASLNRASLKGASLKGVSLNGASLNWASLDGASLDGASLNRASLNGASLDGASLNRASLDGASLKGVSLDGASLDGASLNGATGLNDWVKCIQIDQYPITYTADTMQIGCRRHPIGEWAEFDDARILEMDGKAALKFWRKYKDWIFQTIEMCPAKPTKA